SRKHPVLKSVPPLPSSDLNIDVKAATRLGILVVNAPEGNTLAAAEHALGLLFAAARWIPQAHASLTRDRQWDRKRFMGVQLRGKDRKSTRLNSSHVKISYA